MDPQMENNAPFEAYNMDGEYENDDLEACHPNFNTNVKRGLDYKSKEENTCQTPNSPISSQQINKHINETFQLPSSLPPPPPPIPPPSSLQTFFSRILDGPQQSLQPNNQNTIFSNNHGEEDSKNLEPPPSLNHGEEDNKNLEPPPSLTRTHTHTTTCRSIKSTIRGEGIYFDNDNYDDDNHYYNNEVTKRKKRRNWCWLSSNASSVSIAKTSSNSNIVDKDALGYALRMCLVLTVSVLFVLVSPHDPYPQGSWVYITCCMVSWFPSSMDAASVLKKTSHRIIGTTIGAALALGVGFMVAQIDAANHDCNIMGTYISGVQLQAIVLGFSFGLLSFGLTYIFVHYKNIFGGYSYASILVLMTFGIAVLPFYNNVTQEEKDRMWEKACYRIANVIVGCLLSAAGSVLVMPKSTQDAIEMSVARQIQLAGKSSNAVLQSACDVFSKKTKPIPLAQVINKPTTFTKTRMKKKETESKEKTETTPKEEEQTDTVHDQYVAAIKDLEASKALFPLLNYDPFHLLRCCNRGTFCRILGVNHQPNKKDISSSLFEPDEAAVNLARAFRVQTTVVLLDSIVRNDNNKGQKHFTTEQIKLFSRVGYLIKTMLTLPFCQKNSECALELCSVLGQVREYAFEASNILQNKLHQRTTSTIAGGNIHLDDDLLLASSSSAQVSEWHLEDFVDELESPESGMPMCMASASILFLELLEHLILRTLRLYMRNRNHESLTAFFKVRDMDKTTRKEKSYDGDDGGDDDGD